MPPRKLLCISREPLLLDTRLRILERDFIAEGADGLAGMERFSQQHVDAILICHSITQEERGAIISFARSTWPKAKLLAITKGITSYRPHETDDTIAASEGPRALLRSVHAVLGASLLAAGA